MLSDRDILKEMKAGEIKIDPFEPEQLQSVGYDLRLYKQVRFMRIGDVTHLDVKEKFEITDLYDIGYGGEVIVRPGEMLLGATHECVSLGKNVAGILTGRSSLSRIGLVVDTGGGMIAPGHDAHITFAIRNTFAMPIKIYVGMKIAQISFVKLSSPVMAAYGSRKLKSKYKDKEFPGASKIWKDFE